MMKELLPIWENPEIQEINRLPMQSPLQPFSTGEEAITDALAGPEFRSLENNALYLGLDTPSLGSMSPWKFKLISNPREDLPPEGDSLVVGSKRENTSLLCGWTNPGFDAASWHDINVPGTWTRQGGNSHFENCFDKPHYTNVQMPFQAKPPHVPDENPTGLYRRNFTLPSSWKGRRVVFHLGSAESVSLIYINGFFAGAGKDTRLPSEYDISPFVQEGENLLCIKVIRYSDASYVEDQDQWWLGGIHRTVYLYSTGRCYIKDVKALPGTIIGEEKKQGRINLSITLGGDLPQSRSTGNGGILSTEEENPFIIKYDLYPFILPTSEEDAQKKARELIRNGSLVSGSMELFADFRHNSDMAGTELILDNPKVWSHEAPNLYILSVELYRNGKQLQCAAFCTAFRNLKIAHREFLINDRMVYIKGANRHEHDEKTGKTISTAAMVRDIKILKSHNFNAIRTSHYPDDERWYELCDRYGIYLWNEANIESHCFCNQLCNDTRWTYAFIIRMQRMVERDKNHPAVLVWSLGNESGYGFSHEAGAAWVRAYDPSRPVHYEGAARGKSQEPKAAHVHDNWEKGRSVSDIVAPMYPEIENITSFTHCREDYRPLIMCEFSHAMGNSNGSLADYWKAIESHHGLQGGFIWEWRDHGFEAYTSEGVKYWKYGGDFGDLPTDYDFVCDGLLFPDQSLKPAMAECRQLFSPVRLTEIPGKPLCFTLENNYDFSSLDHLSFEFKIIEDTSTADPASFGKGTTKILKQGNMVLPSLNPGEKAEINFASEAEIFIPSLGGAVWFYGEFILNNDTPWANKGHIVARAGKLLKDSPAVTTSANENAANEFAALLKPVLYRVPTQNDGLKTYTMLREDSSATFYYKGKAMLPWIDLDLLNMRIGADKTEDIIWEGRPATRYSAMLLAGENTAAQYKRYASAPGLGTYTLTVAKGKNGQALVLEAVFDLDRELPELPRIGLMAELPASYNEISWFGLGPEESYPDRLAAVFPGRFKHSIAELEVPYVVPQENGSRSGVRNFTMLSSNPAKANITISSEQPFNFGTSRYSLVNMWKSCHTPDLVDLSKGPDGRICLYVDIIQRGVGTATCGPDTREEYRIRPGRYSIKLYIS